MKKLENQEKLPKKVAIGVGLSKFLVSTRINRYEKGVYQPNFGILEKMAMALDVPVIYFLAMMNWHK
ncbi:XRE family transcriptional regulator [Moraxella nonliquefaciens]|nr:XRE family transcriptional regulator [Moraxella nonliquefaciens]